MDSAFCDVGRRRGRESLGGEPWKLGLAGCGGMGWDAWMRAVACDEDVGFSFDVAAYG